MVTKTGTQTNFFDAVSDLIELNYDAIEAYKVAIENLTDTEYKKKLASFMEDHKDNVNNLSHFLHKHEKNAPVGPSTKQWLTKGKVALAKILGDKTILQAMLSNELDTNIAYERMYLRYDLLEDAKDIIKIGLQNERKHKNWIETELGEF